MKRTDLAFALMILEVALRGKGSTRNKPQPL